MTALEALAFPARVSVEVTNRCNQTCRLCPRAGFTRPVGSMHRDRFGRIVAEIAAHRTVLWMHFLGEPLLHPELLDLVADAVSAGVASVGFSTNATLLRPALDDRLLEVGLDRLDVSLDAADPATYQLMRGADHFERATSNLERFLRRRLERGRTRPVVSLQFMQVPEVAAELPAVIERWRPLLAPTDFIKTIEPAPFGGVVADGSRSPEGAERVPCPWLFGSLMVLQDGTVTTCGADWDARDPVGHVDEASLAEIWQGPEMERRRTAHLRGRWSEVELCGSCEDWYLADGHGYRNALPGASEHPGPVAVQLLGRGGGPDGGAPGDS